jgi:hypothetical protein
MPQSIPPGLKQDHVLQALKDLDSGIDHPFGAPTGYELLQDGKRYAPKAVVGLLVRRAPTWTRIAEPSPAQTIRPYRYQPCRLTAAVLRIPGQRSRAPRRRSWRR